MPRTEKLIILTSNNASSTDDKSQSLKLCAKSNTEEEDRSPVHVFELHGKTED